MTLLSYLKIFLKFIADVWLRNRNAKECEKELILALASEESGNKEEEAEFIEGILEFRDTEVRGVMRSVPEMVTIDIAMPLEEISELFIRTGFSRYPVYESKPGNIIGILMLKDVVTILGRGSADGVRELLRPPLFVPESKKISELLNEFRLRKQRMALCVDEFGEVSGLVTQTDIIEEILGELADEKSRGTGKPVADKQGWYSIPGTYPLEELAGVEEPLDEEMPKVETVAGYLIYHAGSIPAKGYRVVIGNRIEVVVTDADERRIKTVKYKII